MTSKRLRRGLVLSIVAGTACVLGLGGWAFAWEPASLVVREHELPVDGWPEVCDGLRIAVLADLHVGSPWNGLDKLERIIDRTLAAQPDLILLPGDFVIHGVVGGRFVSPEDASQRLARLEAPLGVHAVLGNHDWWLGAPRVAAALANHGIGLLEDRATALPAPCPLWLAGITDHWEGPHDVRRALAGIPTDATVIAFTHNPDVFPEIPARVALTVAGHTHGGQVALPWLGRLRVPSAFGERYAIGHVREQGRDLFVSTGLGTSILPVRFRVAPEISLLTVRADGR